MAHPPGYNAYRYNTVLASIVSGTPDQLARLTSLICCFRESLGRSLMLQETETRNDIVATIVLQEYCVYDRGRYSSKQFGRRRAAPPCPELRGWEGKVLS